MALTLSGTNGVVGAGFTVDASGVSVTAGVGTFGSLAAPAAGLTGALPAISAANLTSLPAANIVGVCTSGLTKTGGFGGITMSQLWRINTIFAATTTNAISANWEVHDQTSAGSIGSSMSESSGIFTFPSTGIYFIQFTCGYYDSGTSQRYLGASIRTTHDNSTYITASINYGSIPAISGSTHATVVASTIFDVTDTSTHKCSFGLAPVESGGPNIHASSSQNMTYVVFTRIGDT